MMIFLCPSGRSLCFFLFPDAELLNIASSISMETTMRRSSYSGLCLGEQKYSLPRVGDSDSEMMMLLLILCRRRGARSTTSIFYSHDIQLFCSLFLAKIWCTADKS